MNPPVLEQQHRVVLDRYRAMRQQAGANLAALTWVGSRLLERAGVVVAEDATAFDVVCEAELHLGECAPGLDHPELVEPCMAGVLGGIVVHDKAGKPYRLTFNLGDPDKGILPGYEIEEVARGSNEP